MKTLFKLTAAAGALVAAGAAEAADLRCAVDPTTPVYSMGMKPPLAAEPLVVNLEARIIARGDRASDLRASKAPPTSFEALPADYAMMRLTEAAGRPIWVSTQDGRPARSITASLPSGSLADAIDALAKASSTRWRFDGERIYLFRSQDWKFALPDNRDMAIAMMSRILVSGADSVTSDASTVSFSADAAGVKRVTNGVKRLFEAGRLNAFDITYYKVEPLRGAIDWGAFAERTSSIETISFTGKGASLVLEPTAGPAVAAFLAREGKVQAMGDLTVVAPDGEGATAGMGGCVRGAPAGRGLVLTGGAFERGRVPFSYQFTGSTADQQGRLAVTPGSIVVLSDATPVEGSYMVAVVRARLVEMSGGLKEVQPLARPADPIQTSPVPVVPAAAAPVPAAKRSRDQSILDSVLATR